jgi:hypothetical protein
MFFSKILTFLVTVGCALNLAAQASAQHSHWNVLRNLPFRENYPAEESTERLYDEMLFHRSTQVLQWSLPAMTLWAMKKGSEKQFGEGSNLEGPSDIGHARQHAELRRHLRDGLS